MSKRSAGRRGFLTGAVREAWQSAAGGELAAGPLAEGRRDDAFLAEIARRAMACDFSIYLNAAQQSAGAAPAIEALDLVEELEEQISVFREYSEVCRLNAWAGRRPMPVERGLFELLERAGELHAQTGGAFDITSAPLWKAWGFDRRKGRVPSDEELAAALARVDGGAIELDEARRTARFAKEGLEINLGGIGKGYALDRAAGVLQNGGLEDFLFHGGQSSVLARGTRDGRPAERPGWIVGIVHPLRPEKRIAEVRLFDRALGTSGTATQSFYHRGRRYGHIIDPRTGRPAEGVHSATAIAPDAATADALSTAFYVMGVERAIQFCQDRPELAAILVAAGDKSGAVQIHTAGLPDDAWRSVIA